jgi:hypothetical protein
MASRTSGGVALIRHEGTVMQSGPARGREWSLELLPSRPSLPDPLMGWISSDEPLQQIKLSFPDKDSAVAFAGRQAWDVVVVDPHRRPIRPKSYAENFIGNE